jgi:hypothetical protein
MHLKEYLEHLVHLMGSGEGKVMFVSEMGKTAVEKGGGTDVL